MQMEDLTGCTEQNGRSERRISVDELIKNLTFNITSEPHVGSPSTGPLFSEDHCSNWSRSRLDASSYKIGNAQTNSFYPYSSNHGSESYFSYYSNFDQFMKNYDLSLQNSHKESQATYAEVVHGHSASSSSPRPSSSPSLTPPLSHSPELLQPDTLSNEDISQPKTETSIKLSYSDVVSIPPSPTILNKVTKSKVDKAPISKPAFVHKKGKPRQQSSSTSNSSRISKPLEGISNNLKASGKYGLDNFETVTEKSRKGRQDHKRKNSWDSLSSDRSSNQDDNQSVTKTSESTETINGFIDLAVNKNHRKKVQESEVLFFDPRRIFADCSMQNSNAKPSLSSTSSQSASLDKNMKNEAALNNKLHKISGQGLSPRTTLYINNNLQTYSSRSSNDTLAASSGSVNIDEEDNEPVFDDRCKKNHCPQVPRPPNYKFSGKHNVNPERPAAPSKRSGTRRKPERQSFAGEIVVLLTRYVKAFLLWFISLVADVIVMSSRLTWHMFTTVVHWIKSKVKEIWYKIITRLKPRFAKGGRFSWYHSWSSDKNRTMGLDQNIILPSTGDEAMKRLLACKGKDPYSILGVTKDTTDEDIKKYYKRQAFLVHPDKNRQPGAEEAFKILAHAFDLIGEPEKRSKYDSQMAEENAKENAWHEFSDLLSELHEKMAEAVNTMRCDNCDGKHRRILVDRPWYSARFCERCNVRHAVKEGDVWAESSFFGFLWYYYSCIDNTIYDITEWAACQKENFKHLQANAHHVRYRIVSGNGPHHSNQIPSDAELEEFLNQLYHQTIHGNRFCQSSGNTLGKPFGQQSGGNTSTTNLKKKRKRKKN